MTGFIESPRFPDFVARWAIGGPNFKTITVETYGGDEYRNAAWTQARGEWEVANAWLSNQPESTQKYNYIATRNFFLACMGQLNAFRFKDFFDYLDEGAGVFVAIDATHFQMYKNYAYSPLLYQRKIIKPVSGSVNVVGGTGPTIDYTTGIVTVSSGTPTSWTGQFDVPVRFASDMPKLGLDESTGAMANWQSLKIIEVRNP